jgi:hypothetical protein
MQKLLHDTLRAFQFKKVTTKGGVDEVESVQSWLEKLSSTDPKLQLKLLIMIN